MVSLGGGGVNLPVSALYMLYMYSSMSFICAKCVTDVINVKCPDYDKAFKDLRVIIEKQKVNHIYIIW